MGSALKWFKDRRGFAAGIIAAGFGGGTALFVPIIAYLIRDSGYRTAFVWTGLVQGFVIFVVAQFLRHPPQTSVEAMAPAPGQDGAPRSGAAVQFTTAQMLRTPQFYVMYVAFVLMAIGGLMVTAQAGPMAQSFGLAASALTLAASVSPLANAASRIFWGWASDRIGRETTMIIAFVLQAIALLLVVAIGHLSGDVVRAVSGSSCISRGARSISLFPATLGDYFGSRHATSNYAVLYTAKGVASIVGGGLAALLFERFGTWSAAFYGTAALALVAAALAAGLRMAGSPARRLQPVATDADAESALRPHECDRLTRRVTRWRRELFEARDTGSMVAIPPSAREGDFDLAAAYAVEAELTRARRESGRATVGRKVGFANKAMWRVLKLQTLVWANMYDDTVQLTETGRGSLSMAGTAFAAHRARDCVEADATHRSQATSRRCWPRSSGSRWGSRLSIARSPTGSFNRRILSPRSAFTRRSWWANRAASDPRTAAGSEPSSPDSRSCCRKTASLWRKAPAGTRFAVRPSVSASSPRRLRRNPAPSRSVPAS